MKKLLVLILTFFSVVVFAQNTMISVTPSTAKLLLNGGTVKYPAKARLNEDPRFVYIAKMEGYATQGISIGQLKDKNVADYSIKLEKLVPLPAGYTSKKMQVVGIVDRENKAAHWQGYSFVNSTDYLNDLVYLNRLSEKMSGYGYNSAIKNTVFTEKTDDSQFKIAGELQALSKDTRGSGFQLSVVVNWTVFDVNEGKVVFGISSGGYAETDRADFGEACKTAIESSLPTLMNSTEFQKVVNSKTVSISRGDSTQVKLPKIAAVKPETSSALSKNSLASVVTIRTNGGHGSGFVISADGYILTNAHVVGEMEKVEVIFNNGFEFEGEVVRTNTKRDVALVKIKGKGLIPLPLKTSSEDIYPGMEVIAIGTPESQQLNQSVTKGIISGKRTLDNITYLQTDVAINSGNSGGPVIDITSGEVVGIVVLKIKAVGVEGINFAIPIEEGLKALNVSMP